MSRKDDDILSQSSLAPSNIPSNLDTISVSQVSISQVSGAPKRMAFNPGNQMLAQSFGQTQQK